MPDRRKLVAADSQHPLVLSLAEKASAFDTASTKFSLVA